MRQPSHVSRSCLHPAHLPFDVALDFVSPAAAMVSESLNGWHLQAFVRTVHIADAWRQCQEKAGGCLLCFPIFLRTFGLLLCPCWRRRCLRAFCADSHGGCPSNRPSFKRKPCLAVPRRPSQRRWIAVSCVPAQPAVVWLGACHGGNVTRTEWPSWLFPPSLWRFAAYLFPPAMVPNLQNHDIAFVSWGLVSHLRHVGGARLRSGRQKHTAAILPVRGWARWCQSVVCPLAVGAWSHHARHRCWVCPPPESWHGNSLKPAFAVRKYDPFELATHLQATIVDPQLQDLQGRMKDDASFEDWPAVGKYFDQHILHNSCALAKEGRVPPQALLGLNLHQSFQDAAGNTWMLLPKSTLKVDWAKSGRKKAYKHRALDRLPPNAVEKFADMVRATSNLQIKEAWQNLGFYSADGRINWKGAAKMFDDWNVVLSGPLARQFWQLHHILLSRQTFRIATSMPFTSASIAQLLRSGALVSICMHRCSITTSSTSAACHVPRPKVDQPKRLDQLPPQFLPAHSWSRLGAPCFFVSVVLAQIHTANGHFVFRPNSQSRLRALVSCDACPTSNNCSPSHLYYVRFCGDFWVQCRCCPQHHDASGQRRDLRYLHNLACFFFRFFLVASCILFFVRDVKPSFNAHVTCFCKADASASPAAPSSPSAAEAWYQLLNNV